MIYDLCIAAQSGAYISWNSLHILVSLHLSRLSINRKDIYALAKIKQVHVWKVLQLHNGPVSSLHSHITGDSTQTKHAFRNRWARTFRDYTVKMQQIIGSLKLCDSSGQHQEGKALRRTYMVSELKWEDLILTEKRINTWNICNV